VTSEAQTYEHMAVSYLRSIGISVTGYYPYEHATDVVGLLKLSEPFKYPLKVAIEIAKQPITMDVIDGLLTFSKNASADKVLLLTSQKVDNLDPEVEKRLVDERIVVIKSNIIKDFSATTTTRQAKEEYENVRDWFAPIKLIRELPTFAKQIIPPDIQRIIGEQKIEAWQFLEDAAYCTFKDGLGCEVRQLGKEALFKNEPEGVVITRSPGQFALIYDCKSSSHKYNMTADDERTYVDYITKKKKEVGSLDHCELKYFVIISPDFAGDISQRGFEILKQTQVLLVLIRAETLRKLALWSYKLPHDIKALIELPDVFKQTIVSDATVDSYIKDFDEKYQKRY
jgi:hypothetical protein